MAALRSLVGRLLDRVDRCFLCSVGAKSCTQWFEKDGGCVHLVNESGGSSWLRREWRGFE